MIVVRLIGGLGNQLFQYALGRSLAIKRNDRLCLNLEALSPSFTIGTFPPPTTRDYGLDVFNIAAEIITLEQLQTERANVIWTLTESGCGFFPEVLGESQYHRNLGLIGWWQSEKYFLEHAETIRNDFQFKADYESPYARSLVEEIAQPNSVCIHVRRTDVLKATNLKGPMELEYYTRAIEAIRERVPDARAFVFSDDINWCKKELSLSIPTTFASSADPDQLHPADDLYLMSLCKHFVIANSTYSWWAAWLGGYVGKVIVAPRRWYRNEGSPSLSSNPTSYLNSIDLVPQSWIRV